MDCKTRPLRLETSGLKLQLGSMTTTVLVLNGPNLNLLGQREPGIYGSTTLADIEAMCVERGKQLDLEVTCRQSNHEGELVTWIQEVYGQFAGLVINPGAYTHTSVAIHDAMRSLEEPIIEVHLSNIHQRESFRHRSYVSLVAKGVICGFGAKGYDMALSGLASMLKEAS
jgi:3-dehydroquinate dehydratase-2